MKITGLLAVFAVLSLIIAPAISQPSLKGCACEPRDCQAKSAENCCAKSQEGCISPVCACAGLVSSYSGMDYFDPAYFHSNSGRSTSHSSSGKDSRGRVSSGNAPPPFSPLSAAATDYVGPPEPGCGGISPAFGKACLPGAGIRRPPDAKGHHQPNRSSSQDGEICPGPAQRRRDAGGALLLSRCAAEPLPPSWNGYEVKPSSPSSMLAFSIKRSLFWLCS